MICKFINPELVENKSHKEIIIDTVSFLKYQQTLGYENVNINSMIELLNILDTVKNTMEQLPKVTCSANNLKCVNYRVTDFDRPEMDYCSYISPCKYKISATDDTETSYINNLKRK